VSRLLVAALSALALFAAEARAGTGIEEEVTVREWQHPGPVPLDSVLHGALASDTIWRVQRLQGSATPAVRVAANQVPRLRAMLLRAHRDEDKQYRLRLGAPLRLHQHAVERYPDVCGSCPDQLAIQITLGTQGTDTNLLDLLVWFREARARYVAYNGWVQWISFRADAPELLALVKQVLPRDSVVQRYAWPPQPDSLPPERPRHPGQVHAPPTSGRHPGPG